MPRSARTLLLSSAGCAALFGLLLAGVYFTGEGRWLDNAALSGFVSVLHNQGQKDVAEAVAALCDPPSFVAIALIIIGVGFARRQPRRAAAAAMVLFGSAVTTQVLKPLIAHPRFEGNVVGFDHIVNPMVPPPAFPSGHATAAMSIALAALIVAPRNLRPLTAAGGALFALVLGCTIVTLGWHFPSDIVGGYLVATAWCLMALAALRTAGARWPDAGTIRARARALPTAAAPLAGVATLAAAALAIGNVDRVTRFANAHTTATAAVIAISLCAAALVAAVSLADQRPG
jgi:membrane-associated phospholipid phosphatase